jgi:hypothetical protein
MGKDFLETLLHIAILKSITPTMPNILIIAITLFIVLLPIYLIAKISQISRKKDPVVIYQSPPAIENKAPPPPKEDLNDKIREEIRRQVELEVHQQLKDIRQRLEKDIEIGINAYIHKQRARQARAQELKEKANK